MTSLMKRYRITYYALFLVVPMQACAGGDSRPGVVNWDTTHSNSTTQSITTQSITTQSITTQSIAAQSSTIATIVAVSLTYDSWNKATNVGYDGVEPNTDTAHEIAAYSWGHAVANPVVVAKLRALGEIGQFHFYSGQNGLSFISGAVEKSEYQPYSVGYVKDSFSDISISMEGARDAQLGVFNLPD